MNYTKIVLDIYQIVKELHWNTKGIEFFGFHEFLDDVGEKLIEYVDEFAEFYKLSFKHAMTFNRPTDQRLIDCVTEFRNGTKTEAECFDSIMNYLIEMRGSLKNLAETEIGLDDILSRLGYDVSKWVYKNNQFGNFEPKIEESVDYSEINEKSPMEVAIENADNVIQQSERKSLKFKW